MTPTRSLRGALSLIAAALAVSTAVALPPAAHAAPGSPAPTPPLGWNSWNTFGCDIGETLIKQAADAMVSSGLKAAGYQYVVIDDCWFDPNRDAQGNLRGHPDRFPGGMKALGDYIHSKGLKFGIYQVPTDRTCAQRGGAYPGATGSLGHEVRDAATFASWGVDYLKYDWCSPEGSRDYQVERFTIMRDALRATGRPIVYSINPNSYHADKTGATYNWSQVADLWRTTEDVLDIWQNGNVNAYPMGVVNAVEINAPLAAQAGPGHWNDPDMLVVGRPGLTLTESRSHFTLWSLMAAPLMAGNDIRSMSAEVSAILRNPRLIEVNQDPLGAAGRPVKANVYAKPLADGSVAVALLNRGTSTATMATTAAEIGLSGSSFTLTDLWSGAVSSSSGAINAAVPAHGVAAFRVSGGSPVVGTTSSVRGVGSERCLDVSGGKAVAGADVLVWDCHGAANQLWTSWPNKELRVFGSLCLDAYNGGTTPGTRVISWTCNGQSNQQWTFHADGTIRGASGLCLDVSGGGTANGAKLVLWTCHGGANQRWTRG
ncbi:lectin [Saccharothrix sp. NPDC042600]|uniref:glycoside hydrolase family 27 protein n=1 Tax=Saccharothrix TaxID=2071 RepID=UPI00340AE830|nr:ricin-type beta-trefoil lectin domain protein [Saccharothrix mutabilis subsp. capreolus]